VILGEMCVLSLIYSYVAVRVCRFCPVRCLIIICLSVFFPITWLRFL